MDVQPSNYAALVRTAKRFEAQALGSLLQPIFGEAPKGLLSGGAAEAQWRPMLVENHARAWSDRGGVGIAGSVLREMLRMQGGAQDSAQGAAQDAAIPASPAPSSPRALDSLLSSPKQGTTP
jgi:flagellar protein FlgJ